MTSGAVRGGLMVLPFLLGLIAVSPATAACTPPCGPIPPMLDVVAETPMPYYMVDGEAKIDVPILVTYYVDIDYYGYYFDPAQEVYVTLGTSKTTPAWLKVTFNPARFKVPLTDPTHIHVDTQKPADEIYYYWEGKSIMTIEQVRDPTEQELASRAKIIRRDGSAHVIAQATSNSSYIAQPVLGEAAGLAEGYASRTFRMTPVVDGVPYKIFKGKLTPNGEPVTAPEGDAPGVGVGLMTVLALVALGMRRRW